MTKPMSAKQKKRKKQIQRRRRVLLLLLISIVIISLCLFTPFFNIQTVEVKGNEVIPAEQIIDSASVPVGHNIFRIHKKSIKKSVLRIPEIEIVKINRKLPSKIEINVKETKPFMYLPYETGFVITNENGRVLGLTDTNENLDLLFMTGLEIKKAEICKKISVQDTVTFDIILETLNKFRDVGMHPEIRSCHFDNITNVYIYLTDGTKVIFGKTEDMDYKISVLLNILPKTNREEGAYIDLTTPSRAISGMIEPTPSPSAEPSPDPSASPASEAMASPSPEQTDSAVAQETTSTLQNTEV